MSTEKIKRIAGPARLDEWHLGVFEELDLEDHPIRAALESWLLGRVKAGGDGGPIDASGDVRRELEKIVISGASEAVDLAMMDSLVRFPAQGPLYEGKGSNDPLVVQIEIDGSSESPACYEIDLACVVRGELDWQHIDKDSRERLSKLCRALRGLADEIDSTLKSKTET